MKSVAAVIQRLLEDGEFTFGHTEFEGVVRLVSTGENGWFRGYIHTDEKRRTVHIRTFAPAEVPQNKRLAVAEPTTRISDTLLHGAFTYDMDIGAIAVQARAFVGENDLHDDVIDYLLMANWCAAIDVFFPALGAVLFGDISPKEAIDRVRGRRNDDRNHVEPRAPLRKRMRDIVDGSSN